MGEPAQLDSDAKQRIKDALVAQAEADLSGSRASVAHEDSAARLDQDSSFAVDDQSQADVAGDLGRLLESNEERQAGILMRIDELDFGPKTEIGPGAVISVDGDRYVVGVVASAFDCDGAMYEGISSDSPIYAALRGRHAGDTITFHGHEQHIDFVA
jgi:transcription elongation GreA/GreB family factor